MKSNFIWGAIALALSSMTAFAGVTPMSGIRVGVDHCPPGDCVSIASGVTDDKGSVAFSDLKSGHYTLVIDGKSLVAAADMILSTTAKTSSSRSSGGSLFGSGSRSPSKHETRSAQAEVPSNASAPSAMHLNLPADIQSQATMMSVIYDWNPGPGSMNSIPSGSFKYNRETAMRGVRIEFTIPKGLPSVKYYYISFKRN